MWSRIVCLLALTHLSAGVIVKVGDFTFPLETVKKMKEVVDGSMSTEHHVQRDDIRSYKDLCSNSALPELRDLCQTDQSNLMAETLRALGHVADRLDECEICAFAACTGC
ncbi:guanylin-like [Rhinoderma darwinii]|uniref:guanylin-like n=1 Tax=Rhinoderma darwinii TaxID=43563 RepID=UPI003F66760D